MSEVRGAARWQAEDEDGSADGASTIRVMTEADIDVVTALDAKETGHARKAYYVDKIARCIREPRMNTSLLAERDGAPVGFLLGRLLSGEFGIPATRAVLDTLGVHPAFRQHGIARELMLQYRRNMQALRVEAIDTLVDWDRFGLLAFLKSMGFRPSRDVDLVWDVARYPFAGREVAVAVRAVEQADLEAVAGMDAEATGERRRDYFAAKWRTAQAQPEHHRFLLAEQEGEPAGFIVANRYQGEFGIQEARGVVDSIGVRERFQHRGVASGLLQALLEWLEAQGVTQMETLCRWNDWELLRFFEYAGFRPSARFNLEWRPD